MPSVTVPTGLRVKSAMAGGCETQFSGDPEQIRTADLLLDREAC